MLLSKLHIHKVKDLYHLSPLFFELQKFPSFLPVVALQSFNLSKISLDFFFERSIFSFTEVILWFSSPSISECLSHMVELQCFVSEMLQPFSLITTYDPHGTPAIHLQQQKWVCLDTIYPCLLFSVALLCFRAIISAAVKLCLYTYFCPECRWKEYQSD